MIRGFSRISKQIGHSSLLQTKGASSILGLLTRDAAEKEQDVLKKELEKARETIKEREDLVKQRDARIAELEQQGVCAMWRRSEQG